MTLFILPILPISGVMLSSFATTQLELSFYFPKSGSHDLFPASATFRSGKLAAVASGDNPLALLTDMFHHYPFNFSFSLILIA